MMTIVDYGLGNIQAFVNVYRRLHIPIKVAKTADELAEASKIILPGVGAFDHAVQKLSESGMRSTLVDLVQQRKIPVLGICVGMQILANSSEEGQLQGLGWIPGRVRSFRSVVESAELPLPHMGWNDVCPVGDLRLFKGIESNSRFYFLHSYFFEAEYATNISATTSYGLQFSSVVADGNIFGVQFHPEKSHNFGVTLLKNFAEL